MAVQPSLRQLRFLVALDEQLHFTAAAEQCFVTQSTLSTGIRELEEQVGQQLVERTKRHVMMTPAGARMADRARAILRDVDDMVAELAAAADPFQGHMTLGVIPTIGPYLLPAMLKDFARQWPDLKLFLRELRSDDLIDELTEGEIDLGLLALPFDGLDAFSVAPVGDDAFHFICAPDHPLAGKGPIHRDAITMDDLLLLEEGHCLRDHALGACSLKVSERRKSSHFQGTSLATLVQMVEAGLGVTLIPDMALRAGAIDPKRLCIRPIKSAASMGRGLGMIWRKTSHLGDAYTAIADRTADIVKAQ